MAKESVSKVTPTTAKTSKALSLNDALVISSQNARFAAAILEQPEKFEAIFNLDKIQIAGLKDIRERMKIKPGDVASSISYE